MATEIEQLRQEAEALKNQIRVYIYFFKINLIIKNKFCKKIK